jgi:hypothetical protein
MLLAITALLSFPLVISHKFNKSRMTITKNLFSCQKIVKVSEMSRHISEPIQRLCRSKGPVWQINVTTKWIQHFASGKINGACMHIFLA